MMSFLRAISTAHASFRERWRDPVSDWEDRDLVVGVQDSVVRGDSKGTWGHGGRS